MKRQEISDAMKTTDISQSSLYKKASLRKSSAKVGWSNSSDEFLVFNRVENLNFSLSLRNNQSESSKKDRETHNLRFDQDNRHSTEPFLSKKAHQRKASEEMEWSKPPHRNLILNREQMSETD